MAHLLRWEPFRELVSLREAMDRLFEESFVRPREGVLTTDGAGALAVDMYETSEEVIVRTALPGVDPDDIDVSVVGDTLTIRGETKAEEKEEGANYIRRERRYGTFSRSLLIPSNVVADKAAADFSKGILTLRLPKAEEVKPKRIEIKTR
jgi:HSP20 family protein